MTGKEKGKSVNRTARVAGFLYLLVFPLAIFSLNVRDTLIVPEDAPVISWLPKGCFVAACCLAR